MSARRGGLLQRPHAFGDAANCGAVLGGVCASLRNGERLGDFRIRSLQRSRQRYDLGSEVLHLFTQKRTLALLSRPAVALAVFEGSGPSQLLVLTNKYRQPRLQPFAIIVELGDRFFGVTARSS